MTDLATVLKEANALPLTGGSTTQDLTRERYHESSGHTFILEADPFVLIGAGQLESVLRTVIACDAQASFDELEMSEATTAGIEFATLRRFEPVHRIVISRPQGQIGIGGYVSPGPPERR